MSPRGVVQRSTRRILLPCSIRIAKYALNFSKLIRLRRSKSCTQTMVATLLLVCPLCACAFLMRASATAVHDYFKARSLLIITALDAKSAAAFMRMDAPEVHKDIMIPRRWAGSLVQLRHVILLSDQGAYDALFNRHRGHSSGLSHVRFEFVPELTTYASKVHYAVSMHKNYRFIMLWNLVNFSFSSSAFSEVYRFTKSRSPFMLHYESKGIQSTPPGSVQFESYALDDVLDVDTDSLRSVKSWEMVMMQTSLFITIGGLHNFTHCGYACVAIKARLEGARLWQLKVPETPAPVSRLRDNFANATWIKLSETCDISTNELAKFLPSRVTRNGRTRIALVHEMVPLANQGGNIRLIEILDVLLVNELHIQIFVRDNIDADMILLIKGKLRVKVWSDNFQLTTLTSMIEEFDVVVSAMWFWNQPARGDSATIPLVVDAILASSMLDIKHVVITDDIHASRCFQTVRGDASFCSKVRRQEESVWSSFRMLKVFVSREDLAHAASVFPEARDSMTFLPYMIGASTVSNHSNLVSNPIRSDSFKLAYFGKAHPANVMAVNALLEALSQCKYNIYNSMHFSLVGDEKWMQVQEVKRNARQKRKNIHIQVRGELPNLEHFLSSVDLVLAPVIVGETGVSSKIFKCIELRIPFVSTRGAMRGFECDDECRELFFAETIEGMLTLLMRALFEPERTIRMVNKLTYIGGQLTHANVRKNAHLMLVLSNSPDYVLSSHEDLQQQSTALQSLSLHGFECENNSSQVDCLQICELKHPRTRNKSSILSVYSSLLGGPTDSQFLESFVADVLKQCFDQGAWEVVIASADDQILTDFRSVFVLHSRRRETDCVEPDVRTVLLERDRGLYETWDLLIQNFTKGKFLTNWNIDDRKHRQALSIKVRVLQNSPKIDVVSSSVFASSRFNQDWNSCQSTQVQAKKCQIWFSERAHYALSAFVQTDSKSGKITNVPQNYPHNAPVYRRSIHSVVEYFSSDTTAIEVLEDRNAPTCFDWKLWAKLAARGGVFFNLDVPLEVYYIRSDSHGRRDATSGNNCINYVFQNLSHKGLYNNAFFWNFDFSRQFMWHKRILLLTSNEYSTSSPFQSSKQKDFVSWMTQNGHDVATITFDLSDTSDRSKQEILAELKDDRFLEAFDMVLFDDLSNPKMRKRVSRSKLAKLIRVHDIYTVGMFEHVSAVHHGCAGMQCSSALVFSDTQQGWTWGSRHVIQLELNSASWSQNKRLLRMFHIL